jgi:hypothetical protein
MAAEGVAWNYPTWRNIDFFRPAAVLITTAVSRRCGVMSTLQRWWSREA